MTPPRGIVGRCLSPQGRRGTPPTPPRSDVEGLRAHVERLVGVLREVELQSSAKEEQIRALPSTRQAHAKHMPCTPRHTRHMCAKHTLRTCRHDEIKMSTCRHAKHMSSTC